MQILLLLPHCISSCPGNVKRSGMSETVQRECMSLIFRNVRIQKHDSTSNTRTTMPASTQRRVGALAAVCQSRLPKAPRQSTIPRIDSQRVLSVSVARTTFAALTAAKIKRKPALPITEILVSRLRNILT